MSTEEAAGRPIESVERALRLLVLLDERDGITVSEAADRLGVARSSAHRLLGTLVGEGFARQDPGTKVYHRGGRLARSGPRDAGGIDVRPLAHPHLEALRRELDATASLSQLDGGGIRFLDAVEARSALRVGSRVGLSMDAHCTSAGKAMLAALPVEEVIARLGPGPLKRFTPNTVITIDELLADLAEVRERGWAENREEGEDGVASVGVAVTLPDLRVFGLGVAVPAERFDDARRAAMGAALLPHARELMAQLADVGV